MAGKKSKNKGSSFEREVRDVINKATGIKLERTPGSGGWGRMQTKGDLIAPADKKKQWPYFVECKKVEGWDMWNMLFSGEGPLFSWWLKAVEQAEEEKKIPLLIFAQNRREILVMFEDPKNDAVPELGIRVIHNMVVMTTLDIWLEWMF